MKLFMKAFSISSDWKRHRNTIFQTTVGFSQRRKKTVEKLENVSENKCLISRSLIFWRRETINFNFNLNFYFYKIKDLLRVRNKIDIKRSVRCADSNSRPRWWRIDPQIRWSVGPLGRRAVGPLGRWSVKGRIEKAANDHLQVCVITLIKFSSVETKDSP